MLMAKSLHCMKNIPRNKRKIRAMKFHNTAK